MNNRNRPRQWTAAEKAAIVTEYEAAPRGKKRAVAEKHGVCRSYVSRWMRDRDAGGEFVGTRDRSRKAKADKRKSYAADKKARIVAEYAAASRGEKAAVLRKYGVTRTHISEWRRVRKEAGRFVNSTERKRGPK